MPARVLYRDAQGRTGEVALSSDEPCYVGRALDCAVRTDDAMVSRKHSLIRMEHGRYVVEDLGSSNGTHVNDIKVARQTLNHNDVVRCGNLWLRFVDDSPVEAAPVKPADASPSSKFRSTLGGKSDAAAAGAVVSSAAAQPVTEPPPSPSTSPGAPAVSPTVMPVEDDPPPPVERSRTPTPAPVAPVIRPDVRGKPVPHRPPTPHARAVSSNKPTGPELFETDPAGRPSREDLERRLAIAGERARELERGLLTLQAELHAAQEKIKALLRGVQELTGLE